MTRGRGNHKLASTLISTTTRVRIALLILLGVLCLLAVMPLNVAHGGGPLTFVVNDSGDGVPGACDVANCTLREAIIAANNNPFADNIVVADSITEIDPTSQMDFIDVSDGISFNGGDGFTLDGNGLFNFGLVFITTLGVNAQDVAISNVAVARFKYDGLQVCGGVNNVTQTCDSNVNNVTLENVAAGINAVAGIRVIGNNISGVTASGGTSANSNGVTGLWIEATSNLSNVNLTGIDAPGNGITAGNGVSIIGGSGMTGVTITGGHYNSSHDHGLYLHGGGTTSQISVSGLLVDGNGGSGITLSSTGGSMPSTTVTGVTANGNGGHGIEVNSSAGLGGSITGSTAVNNTLFGIHARGGLGIGGFSITGNTVDANDSGIYVETGGKAQGVNITGNEATNSTDDHGIFFDALTAGGNNHISANTLTGNGGDGISLLDEATAVISRNVTHLNGELGIDLSAAGDPLDGVTPNDVGDGDNGPNGLLNFPEWTVQQGYKEAAGTACANCLVEVFYSDSDPSGHGEGKEFAQDTMADGSGHFSIDLCPLNPPPGTLLTATATDADGNTSEFSENYETLELVGCPTSTPSPSPTPTHSPTPSPTTPAALHKQGDLNCDGKIDGLDALIAMLAKLGLALPAGGTCGPIGSGSPKFGDVNCSGAVDEVDALAILAFKAQATLMPKPPSCKAIGELLS